MGIKQKPVGTSLTQNEWEAASSHVMDAAGIPYATATNDIATASLGAVNSIFAMNSSSVPAFVNILPTIALGGTVSGAVQAITNIGGFSITDGYSLYSTGSTFQIDLRGGVNTAGSGGLISLYGKDHVSNGQIIISTPNATENADVARVTFAAGAATAAITWANSTHAGFTLGANLTSNGYDIVAGALDSQILIWGGTTAAGGGAILRLGGQTDTSHVGELLVYTPNAAGNDNVARLSITGVVDTAVANWTNTKQVFDAASLPNGDPGLAGQLYYTAADGIVRRSAG